MSSFSFMNDDSDEAHTAPAVEEPQMSGFSFVSESLSHPEPAPNGSHMPPAEEIRMLPRAASMKPVKKKKKATRVGFGRDEAADDDLGYDQPEHPAVDGASSPLSLANSTTTDHSHSFQQDYPHHQPVPEPQATPLSIESFHLPDDSALHDDPGLPLSAPPLPPTLLSILEGSVQASEAEAGSLAADKEPQLPPPPPQPIEQIASELPVEDGRNFDQPAHSTLAGSSPAANDLAELADCDPELAREIARLREVWVDAADALDFAIVIQLLKLSKVSLNLVKSAGDGYMAAIRQQQQLVADVEESHNAMTGIVRKIDDLEQQQVALAKQERFEQADQLSTEILALQNDLVTRKLRHASLLNQLHEQSQACSGAKTQLLLDFSEFRTNVGDHGDMAKQQIAAARELLVHTRSEEEKRVDAVLKRSEMERAHYDREQQGLEADAAIVEDAIKLEVGDQYDKKVLLELELTGLQGEIRLLEEQLAAKRKEEARLQRVLQAEEVKINEARKKYDRKLQRIEDRRRDLEQAMSECNQELYGAQQKKQALYNRFDDLNHTLDAIENYLQHSSAETLIAQRISDDLRLLVAENETELLQNAVLALKVDDEDLLKESFSLINFGGKDSFLEARASVRALDREAAEVAASANEVAAEFEATKAAILAVSDSINRFEAEKKVLAASKKFKEAGIVAKDIKDLQTKKSELEEQSAGLLAGIVETEKRKGDTERRLAESRAHNCEQEMQWFAVLYRRLYSRIRTVSKRLATAQHDTAVIAQESGTGAFSSELLQAAIFVYEEELATLRRLESALKEKHQPPPECISTEEHASEELADLSDGSPDVAEAAPTPAIEEVASLPSHSEEAIGADSTIDTEASPDDQVLLCSDVVDEGASPSQAEDNDQQALAAKIEILEEEIRRIEAEIQEAADCEDYDKASELQDTADSKKQELDSLRKLLHAE